MLHLAQGRRRSLVIFCTLLGSMLASLPGHALATLPPDTPGAAALPATTSGISAAPGVLALSVPLGQIETPGITVTNTSNQPLIPAIYEAYAAPQTQALRSMRPELRSTALPHQASRVDPQLVGDLRARPGQRGDFLVYLGAQADLSPAYAIDGWQARGAYVYRQLHDFAEQSQRGVRAALDARQVRYRPFWIVNALMVSGTLDDALVLASRSDVALVRANHTTKLLMPQAAPAASADSGCSPDNPSDPICWNIRQISANRVWRDFGVTGQGVVVASMDTGVRYTHPALATHYRGYRGPGSYDHNYNWFDPKGLYTEPIDNGGHGTHTTGTMVANGNGTLDAPSVGVAPGAEWIAAQGCLGATCNEADLIAAAQWMLAPTMLDGTQPRPDLRPMIVNNSWAGTGGDDWYAGYVAAWRAAGIFPVFAAGNTGSACGSIGSPGDYADVLTVGATDPSDAIGLFSARGPTADGRSKPDFVAPGASGGGSAGVLSTGNSDTAPYITLQGTSMAAPHVSGVVALLWSANPVLIGDYDATFAILRESARGITDSRCGSSGVPNNVYGNGRIDAYAAIQRAHVDVPWLSLGAAAGSIAPGASANVELRIDAAKVPGPGTYSARVLLFGADLGQQAATIEIALTVTAGSHPTTLTGRVVSAETGTPLAARVGVRGGQTVTTDANGAYSLTLAAGSYDLVASAAAYISGERVITLTGDLRLDDIALQPDMPRISFASSAVPSSLAISQSRTISMTLGNTGSQPLYYTVHVAPDQFAAMRSDEAGGPQYRWVDLPPEAGTLRLSDDGYAEGVPLGITFPFYGYTFTDTLVTANGSLAFSSPSIAYSGLSSGCFPDNSFYFYEIAPFHADLDPSSGGQIRFGTTDDKTAFVLTYERVPLQDATNATYSFQVLLYNDGRIVFQYKQLGALPSALAVGLQRAPLEYQKIGCGKNTAIHDGLAIELRPQVSVPQWLHIAADTGALPVAQQQTITATLDWVYSPAPIQRASIKIASNDQLHSPIVLPISVEMLPPPRRSWLPFVPHAAPK